MANKEVKDIEHYVIIEGKKIPSSKLPCAKCERASALCCPKPDCWNKDGKYIY